MATWDEISQNSLEASHVLLNSGNYRSSVSRAYFSLYALCTARLHEQGFTDFGIDRDNPSHQQMLVMLEHNLLNALRPIIKRRVIRASKTVQRARIVADYGPGQTIDHAIALGVIRDASFVARELGSEVR